MPAILRRIIIIFAVIIFVLFLALIIGAWSLGAFDSVQITEKTNGPYYLISLDTRTGYRDIPVIIEEIKGQINLPPEIIPIPAALINSNPMMTPLNEVDVTCGLIVTDSLTVNPPLHLIKIESRTIVSASIETNPSIAIFKTYPALAEWLSKNDREYEFQLPFLEIYNSDEVTVEMTIVARK